MARIRSIKPEFPQLSRDARGHFKKATIPAAIRRQIAERHGCKLGETVSAQCHYCRFIGSIQWFAGSGRKNSRGWVAFGELEMDHIQAEISGGTTSSENIVLACRACNRSKGAKDVRVWNGGSHA